jgi:hypothetical protein
MQFVANTPLSESPLAPDVLAKQATDILVAHQYVSISLLQRRLRIGYTPTLHLLDDLERRGVVTPPDESGRRNLMLGFVREPGAAHALDRETEFECWALEPFSGCDGGDPGNGAAPSIWLFGIEHGASSSEGGTSDGQPEDEKYSITTQMLFKYNQNAFRLFAAIQGEAAADYRSFAERHQPWVEGSKGYFKGNLYPYACHSESSWSPEAQAFTGYPDKATYLRWCDEHRLPRIKQWVDQHSPRLFIGVGITYNLPMEEYRFEVNGHLKRILYAQLNGKTLVVIPHLSGTPHGINGSESATIAGTFIAGLLKR